MKEGEALGLDGGIATQPYVYQGPNLAKDMEELERFRAQRRADEERQNAWKTARERAKTERAALRDRTPVVDLSVDSIVEALERAIASSMFTVDEQYVRHLLQPYCKCETGYDDTSWDLCEHARDLGY